MQENPDLPLIIAHRGASASAPENTLAAFRQAIEAGADGLEFDVQLAKDGVPVVFHDFTLQRMLKKKHRTSNLTVAELQTLDIGAWFNNFHNSKANVKFNGESIPTLAEFFEFLDNYKGRLYVELKCETNSEVPKLVETVINTIRQTNSLPNVILKSFNLEAVALARKIFPDIRTAALFAPKIGAVLHKNNYLFEQAQNCGANELSIHYSLATPKTVALAERLNIPVTIWTADNPVWIKRALKRGIKAIITNHPARLLEKRREILQSATSSGF